MIEIDGAAIYEIVLPELPVATGDLYSQVTEFGNTGSSGIVLTPMCDLAQGKVEWVKLAQAIPFKTHLEQTFLPESLKGHNEYQIGRAHV